MKSEQNTNLELSECKNVSFADMGKFIQETWASPGKRLNQTVAVGSSMLQGGCEVIAEEAQHHPDKLAQRAVTTLGAGALFGLAMTCEAPVIVGAATVTGAVMTGMWLGEMGHKLYTNREVRSNLDKVWKTGSPSNYQELKQNLGNDGRDLILATAFGTAGFSAGSKLSGFGSAFKPADLSARPIPALATAGEGTTFKPRFVQNMAENSENTMAMSKANSFDAPDFSFKSNGELFESVRTIKDAIKEGDLEHAEHCAFLDAVFAEDNLVPSKELDAVTRSFYQIKDTLRQAICAPENRREILVNEALKKLDSLERVNIEKIRDLSIERESQALRDFQKQSLNQVRTKEKEHEPDELTKFLFPEEDVQVQPEHLKKREHSAERELSPERKREIERELEKALERAEEQERERDHPPRRIQREERDRFDDFGR